MSKLAALVKFIYGGDLAEKHPLAAVLASHIRGGDRNTIADFEDLCFRYPLLLFPVVNAQRLARRKTLGEAYWAQYFDRGDRNGHPLLLDINYRLKSTEHARILSARTVMLEAVYGEQFAFGNDFPDDTGVPAEEDGDDDLLSDGDLDDVPDGLAESPEPGSAAARQAEAEAAEAAGQSVTARRRASKRRKSRRSSRRSKASGASGASSGVGAAAAAAVGDEDARSVAISVAETYLSSLPGSVAGQFEINKAASIVSLQRSMASGSRSTSYVTRTSRYTTIIPRMKPVPPSKKEVLGDSSSRLDLVYQRSLTKCHECMYCDAPIKYRSDALPITEMAQTDSGGETDRSSGKRSIFGFTRGNRTARSVMSAFSRGTPQPDFDEASAIQSDSRSRGEADEDEYEETKAWAADSKAAPAPRMQLDEGVDLEAGEPPAEGEADVLADAAAGDASAAAGDAGAADATAGRVDAEASMLTAPDPSGGAGEVPGMVVVPGDSDSEEEALQEMSSQLSAARGKGRRHRKRRGRRGVSGETAHLSQVTHIPEEPSRLRDSGLCDVCETGVRNTLAEVFGYNVANSIVKLASRDESKTIDELNAATTTEMSVKSGKSGQREDSEFVKMLDEGTGKYFYYHIPSGESQWEQPHSYQVRTAARSAHRTSSMAHPRCVWCDSGTLIEMVLTTE